MPEQNESARRIAAIRERLSKVSAGPWTVWELPSDADPDLVFITHAHEDVVYLLAQLEAALNPVEDGWVTIGTITTDMENETQTFVRSNPVEGKEHE